MVAGMRFKAAMVTALACAAGSCTSCDEEGVDKQFTSDEALDAAPFVAEVLLHPATACPGGCDWGFLWRYEISVTRFQIGTAPPALVTSYANFSETDVLVAARRFANSETPRFILVGNPVLAPGGEDGAICGLPSTTPVMVLSPDNVFVFTEAGDGLASVLELLWLHGQYPDDRRKGGYTYRESAAGYANTHPASIAMNAIERSRQRRPTREPFSTDGRERVCRQAGNGDAGERVVVTACDAGRSPIGERACN